MSAEEILAELPKLTRSEREILARRLRELEEQDGLEFLHEAASEMFRELDKREAEDAHRKAR